MKAREDAHVYSYKYHWKQTFPKGKEITIEHTYLPAVGTSVGGDGREDLSTPETTTRYCIDSKFKGGLDTVKKLATDKLKKHWNTDDEKTFGTVENKLSSYVHYNTFHRVDYILKTGANWKGPIQSFKLTIEKDPDDFVSACLAGVPELTSEKLVLTKKDFTPTQDLQILFISHFDPNKHVSVEW